MTSLPREHGGTRTTTSAITFSRAFCLGLDPRELPAGTYTLHTDEHLFSSGDHSWSARAEMVVEVPQDGHMTFRHVLPADLDRAVAADAKQAALMHGASENPNRGSA